MTVANPEHLQFPCRACGAKLRYDPGAERLSCAHCGYTEAIPGSEAEVVEHGFASFRADPSDWSDELRHWNCTSCGAMTATERAVTAHTCPFCAANLVGAAETEVRQHVPESLLPFQIDKKNASTLFREWIRSLWFRPTALKTQARLGTIRGAYLPFWTYDTFTKSFWTAESGTYYYVTDSEGNRKRKVRWTRVSGTHTEFFDDELVVGSQQVEHGLIQQVTPFPTQELVPYRPEFIAGYTALTYDADMLECWPTAKARIDVSIRHACRRAVPGDMHRGLMVSTSYLNKTYKLCLLPLWLATYRYRNASYTYLVNGVTGEVAGRAPWSILKLMALLVSIAGAAYGIIQYTQ